MDYLSLRILFRNNQVARFLAVGAVNTGFSYGVYSGLLFMGLNYALANLAALSLGIIFSFKTQGALVFQNGDNRLFGRYILGWGVIYLLSVALIGHLMAAGLNAYIAGALATLCSAALSYLVMRRFVFRTGLTQSKINILLNKDP